MNRIAGLVALSRRSMLKSMFLSGTALIAFPKLALAREFRGGETWPWAPGVADTPYFGTETGSYLNMAERAFVYAATARLIPSDDDGPGAREADVLTFIDRQLAGFYGRGQRWYMKGPWPEGLATQGYQSQHTPAELFRVCIDAIDQWCATNHDARFADLDEAMQDQILERIEAEDVTIEGAQIATFFDLLKEITIEGFFADPIYGGNRDMVAWHYVGFPGARYDYRDFIHHDGAPITMPPVSLAGRPGWNVDR
ncbi:gluconate 2-dehydrogenase subunit 3 family protein [Pelagibacterium lentulum]|nr:gluconate 2-dehydrogenase subunit 3 family protein [Pelagibacterium lentulum]